MLKRLRSSGSQSNRTKLLVVSLQKCGTHLILKLLEELGCRGTSVREASLAELRALGKGEFLWSHFSPRDDVQMALEDGEPGLRVILNVRDPRDALVSWYHMVRPENERSLHSHQAYMKKVYAQFTRDQLIDFFIRNEKFRAVEYNPIEAFRLARSLYFHPAVHVVRYEDLVGERGGGDRGRQVSNIKAVCEHLGIECSDPEELGRRIYDESSPTFRAGRIGEHRSELTAEQRALFERLHGDVVEQFGYERDDLAGSP